MSQVSVIVPVYQVEKYLNRCVDSIRNQDFTDFEMILTDDGSPDHCGAICDEFATVHFRTVVIHQSNMGVSVARNMGIEIASGKYVAFVDSDDWVAGNLLSTTVPYMEQGYHSVNFGCKNIYLDKCETESPIYIGEIQNKSSSQIARFLLCDLIQYKIGWEPWSRIFRRDVIEKNKIRFPDGIAVGEDLCFAIYYYTYTRHHISIKDSLYNYFKRSNSVMQTIDAELNTDRMNELLKRIYSFYKKRQIAKDIMDSFPVLYYIVMKYSIMSYQNDKKLSSKDLRIVITNSIRDKKFAKRQIRKLRKRRKILLNFYYPRCKAEYMIEQARYFVFGNKLFHMLSRVKQKLMSVFEPKDDISGNY